MKKIVSIILCAIMLLSICQCVSAVGVGDVIGYALYSDIVAKINGRDIASFNINGLTAVVAEDLRNYGFNVEWNEQQRALNITGITTSKIASDYVAPKVASHLVGQIAHNVVFTDIGAYINGKSVKSYNIGGKTVVNMNDLAEFGGINWDPVAKVISFNTTEIEATTPSGAGGIKIGDTIDYAEYSNIVAQINGHDIASFNINGNTAVVAEDLRNYGFDVQWDEQTRSLYITRGDNAFIASSYVAPYVAPETVGKAAHSVLYTDIGAYVNGRRVTSHNIGGSTVIYMNDLAEFGEFNWNDAAKIVSLTVKGLGSKLYYQPTKKNPQKTLSIACSKMVRGEEANRIAEQESNWNKAPDANQEWCFMEFSIKYISSSAGNSDVLKGNELISLDSFTASGSRLEYTRLATLDNVYKGAGVLDAQFYPGESGKIVIGFMINKKTDNIALKIYNSSQEKYTDVKCEEIGSFFEGADETADASDALVKEAKGALKNPYTATEGASVIYQEWQSDPQQKLTIKCTNAVTGDAANRMAETETVSNSKPEAGQSWCFLEFDLKYESIVGGDNNVLRSRDIINSGAFYTLSGSKLNVIDMATLGNINKSNDARSKEFYPGESGKVVIGLLIEENNDGILLCIPNASGAASWIKCK